MFYGEYSHTLDAKGRLILPAKFREELGENFFLSRGLDGCLSIYTEAGFNELNEKLATLPLTDKNSRFFTRYLMSGSEKCTPDKQGRISIPAKLRTELGLEKDVTVIGMGKRIEIWDARKHEDNINDLNENIDEVLERMSNLGFTI